jgi:hypothetical protein
LRPSPFSFSCPLRCFYPFWPLGSPWILGPSEAICWTSWSIFAAVFV